MPEMGGRRNQIAGTELFKSEGRAPTVKDREDLRWSSGRKKSWAGSRDGGRDSPQERVCLNGRVQGPGAGVRAPGLMRAEGRVW